VFLDAEKAFEKRRILLVRIVVARQRLDFLVYNQHHFVPQCVTSLLVASMRLYLFSWPYFVRWSVPGWVVAVTRRCRFVIPGANTHKAQPQRTGMTNEQKKRRAI
jgi:hypothetical protein